MANCDELLTIGYGAFPKDGEPFTALSGRRENIVTYLEAVLARQKEHNIPDRGFTITMPCGYEQNFKEVSDIPIKDLPCPCGKAERFLITLF